MFISSEFIGPQGKGYFVGMYVAKAFILRIISGNTKLFYFVELSFVVVKFINHLALKGQRRKLLIFLKKVIKGLSCPKLRMHIYIDKYVSTSFMLDFNVSNFKFKYFSRKKVLTGCSCHLFLLYVISCMYNLC